MLSAIAICNCRGDKAHVFEPQNKEEISAMREWMEIELPNFHHQSSLWLGFVKPRFCDGTGQVQGLRSFYTQWAIGSCEESTPMNEEMFSQGQPDNWGSKESCVVSTGRDVVSDVQCVWNERAYAVCEFNVEFDIPRINETDTNSNNY